MIPSGNLAELSNIVICSWITYQKWSIFHSYVRLPEGIPMSQYKLPEAKSFIVTNKHYQSLYSSITIHVGKTMPCLPPMAGNDANIPPIKMVIWGMYYYCFTHINWYETISPLLIQLTYLYIYVYPTFHISMIMIFLTYSYWNHHWYEYPTTNQHLSSTTWNVPIRRSRMVNLFRGVRPENGNVLPGKTYPLVNIQKTIENGHRHN